MPTIRQTVETEVDVEVDFDLSDYEYEIKNEYCNCNNCLIDDEPNNLRSELQEYVKICIENYTKFLNVIEKSKQWKKYMMICII